MRRHRKKKVVLGLSIMFMLIAPADMLPRNLTSYAKKDEKILSGGIESEFEIDEKGVLTAYHGDGGDVVIPEGVTEIGYRAFEDCSSLTSVTIPEGVTTIGGAAFEDCSSLTNVTIPKGVTYIDGWTFNGCNSLINVTIPEGVTIIGYSTFENCSSLTSITIPEGVTSIDGSAFKGCNSLTNVMIPKGVTEIGRLAFEDCSNLTNVTISEGIAWIGEYAFSGCNNLRNVTILEKITEIDFYAFSGCNSLNIYCYADSSAERYAKEHDIPYQLIDDVENLDITTTEIPYNTMIQNNNRDNENEVSYSLKEDSLSDEMELQKNGELYIIWCSKRIRKIYFSPDKK